MTLPSETEDYPHCQACEGFYNVGLCLGERFVPGRCGSSGSFYVVLDMAEGHCNPDFLTKSIWHAFLYALRSNQSIVGSDEEMA